MIDRVLTIHEAQRGLNNMSKVTHLVAELDLRSYGSSLPLIVARVMLYLFTCSPSTRKCKPLEGGDPLLCSFVSPEPGAY